MYLNNVNGNPIFSLLGVGEKTINHSFIRLEVRCEDGFIPRFDNMYVLKENKDEHPEEILEKIDSILGKKLSRLNLNRFIGKKLKIEIQEHSVFKFFLFLDENKKEQIGLITNREEWTEEEDNQWFENQKRGFDFKSQAHFFGRTEEEIQNRYEEKFYQEGLLSSLTSSRKGALNDIKVTNDIICYGVSISPAISEDGSNYYGDVFNSENNTASQRIVGLENTLFCLSKEERNELARALSDDILTINPEVQSSQYLNKKFFDRRSASTATMYVWIKIEDAGDDSFNSYSFAFSHEEDALKEFIKAYEATFLRHIMYLRSKQAESFERINKEERKETRIQAIRSAISTLMSRNMSHNLGSHVLYYTQQDLGAKSNEYDKDIEIITSSDDKEKKKTVVTKLKYIEYSSYLRGASYIVALLKNRTNYVAAISEDNKYPSLPVAFKSEIWDYINIDQSDDDSKQSPHKTINFYLRNLVKSEGYSRNDFGKKQIKGDLRLTLISKINDYLNLALPGGVVSVQAFCNILENFIRNSAKYWSSDRRMPNLEFKIKVTTDNNTCCVLLSDNKGDADSTVTKLNEKLTSLRILNDDNSVNKEDKGIKEMLLSYLWLISNTLEGYDSISSIVYKLDSGDKKAIEYITSKFCYVRVEKNLGLQFYLPLHFVLWEINEVSLDEEMMERLSVDVVYADLNVINKYKLNKVFPRIVSKKSLREPKCDCVSENINRSEYNEASILYSAICDHFGCDIDTFKIKMDVDEYIKCEPKNRIRFETHFSNAPIAYSQLKKFYDNFLYVDSISGANYTKTLEQLFISAIGMNDEEGYAKFNTWRDYSFALKIKESAITRITLIDERFLLGIKDWINIDDEYEGEREWKNSQVELALKNIRVLGWTEDRSVKSSPFNNAYKKVDEFDSFCGNVFRPIGPYHDRLNKTNFLSIHLGLIDKMLQSPSRSITNICGDINDNYMAPERIKLLMEKIIKVFQPDFMCVHSGRGGLSSKVLEETVLRSYPFVSLATIEYLYNNSKFLLSQMFYSLKYSRI